MECDQRNFVETVDFPTDDAQLFAEIGFDRVQKGGVCLKHRVSLVMERRLCAKFGGLAFAEFDESIHVDAREVTGLEDCGGWKDCRGWGWKDRGGCCSRVGSVRESVKLVGRHVVSFFVCLKVVNGGEWW